MAEPIIKKGLPPWMATFADLCTLLLTFFVLLLTFANMDIVKFKEMLGSVQAAFGTQFKVHGEFQAIKPEDQPEMNAQVRQNQPQAPQINAVQTPSTSEALEAERMARQIREMAQAEGMGQEVELNAGKRGVRLRVKGQLFFDPGEAELKPGAAKFLGGIVKVMEKFNFFLTVEGHTDDQPISNNRFPSNWELSGARASAVLRYLVDKGVSQNRVSAIGYAANYPIASNRSETGRNRNRRVEFIFTKQPFRVAVD